MNQESNLGTPHLTPESLVGQRFSRDTFKGITIALVGFCPRSACLDNYVPDVTSDQYFIHLPPQSVEICKYNEVTFLSLVHVYGGPVASATIEELAYYGITNILAYGLAGGLGTKNLKMGDFYIVESALAADGTTPHYTDSRLISSDESLNASIIEIAKKRNLPNITPVQAMTSDAIYREYDQHLENAKANDCDIVNCDSSHLFAVSQAVGIRAAQCGIISDVSLSNGGAWDSMLSVMLSENVQQRQNPIDIVGTLVQFYVEALIPVLPVD
ncbi:MAG: hypothetical protein JSV68_00720 [Anaerolineaceae bacterium]|nr:MAG: hypothetical protein JSV68_00720 [Anaerolineaceae bacterium]